MFHRNRRQATTHGTVAPPRVRNVRLLETEEDLRAAVERVRAFELARSVPGTTGTQNYERYLGRDAMAEVVAIEASGAVGA